MSERSGEHSRDVLTASMIRTVLLAVVPRPRLWWVALRTVTRLAAPGWWHRWPPIPSPPAEYWRFRMATAYGGASDQEFSVADVVSYLDWCRTRDRVAR